MIALIVVGLIALLLMLLGAIVGAELQSRVQEGQRRRLAERTRRLNAASRERRDSADSRWVTLLLDRKDVGW